jgi:hypothetical protein
MHEQDKEILEKIEHETQINTQLTSANDELDQELSEIESMI